MTTTHNKERLHAILHGTVQGVTFRANTRRTAQQLGITGWVYNRPEGTVEVVAEGTRDELNDLLDFLHEGPPAASVTNVDTEWQVATGEFSDFQIKH